MNGLMKKYRGQSSDESESGFIKKQTPISERSTLDKSSGGI
jgi:hypothetical protein